MRTRSDRQPGWKSVGNEVFDALLEKPTLFETDDPDGLYDDYRVERERVVASFPVDAGWSWEERDSCVLSGHFFQGGFDFYLASYDPDTDIAFGYIDYAEDYEWVQLFLREVETHRGPLSLDLGDGRVRTIKHGPWVECDLYWEQKTFGELVAKGAIRP